jgi:dephospho-CoA kinase
MSGRPPVTVLVQGGIACGKSTVTRLLTERGAVHVDCDRIAHEVLETEAVKALVAEHLGPECVTPKVDRKAIAARVFSDEAALALLESWIHPRVRDRVQAALADAETPEGTPRQVLVVDAAVAEKMQLTEAYDLRLFVKVDLATRQARARKRGWEDGELERREARQDSLADREARADFILPNQGSLEEAARHVEQFWTTAVQPLR